MTKRDFQMIEAHLQELPSGKQSAYSTRIGWVLVYLGQPVVTACACGHGHDERSAGTRASEEPTQAPAAASGRPQPWEMTRAL